jgi:hypothetical protein
MMALLDRNSSDIDGLRRDFLANPQTLEQRAFDWG